VDANETEQFNGLIKPLLGSGFGLACAMLRDREAAEDAVQEAAIKAWQNARKAARPGYAPRPWFLAIVANQCRDTMRTSWWRVLKLAEVPERPRSDYTERVADELDLDRALARLSREQRALLFLRYRLDLAPSEIAEVLSLRPGTVKSRLHRGLRRLQAEMTIPFPEDAR
jgi:RNA polymerase sigma-70 factor (ECF subfamily)